MKIFLKTGGRRGQSLSLPLPVTFNGSFQRVVNPDTRLGRKADAVDLVELLMLLLFQFLLDSIPSCNANK